MSKELTRGTATGLFIAGTILAVVYWIEPDLLANGEAASESSADSEGQQEEMDQLYNKINEKNETIDDLEERIAAITENGDPEPDEVNGEETYTTVLTIEEGDSISHLADRLIQTNMIEDADLFLDKVSE